MDDKLFRGLVENSSDAIFLANDRGEITYASPSLTRVLGYTQAELMGTSGFALVHPDDVPAAEVVFGETLAHPERYVPFALRVRHKDTTYRDVEGCCQSRLSDPAVRAVVVNYRDVSDRRRAERALGASEALRAAMLGAAIDAVICIDHESHILEFNDAAERIFGYTRGAVLGKRLTEVVIPPTLRAQGMSRYLTTGAESVIGRRIELRAMRSDGSEFPVELAISRIPGDGPPKFVGYVRDITEQKAAEDERRRFEAQLLHAQKLESLGLLAGGIAHDFNNLLTAILGYASLARMELPSTSPIVPLLEEIERGGERAADLAQQMLAYSGRGRFLVRTFEMDSLVKEMTQLLTTVVSKKADLRLELGRAPIDGDVTQMRQVVMNLITNASDALRTMEGRITLRTGARFCERATLRSPYVPEELQPGRYCFLEVEDTGCGMTEETLRRMFDPFFSTKSAGRGLGLASVLGIVRTHRGTLRVSSRPGHGTRFEILVPASTAEVRDTAPVVLARPSRARRTGTILVVDDEASVRAFAKLVLENAGFTVRVAAHGGEAVAEFDPGGDDISGMLLDLTMPHMDGLEVARRLRRLRRRVPILVMSGYNESDIARRFTDVGVTGFIKKPFSPDELVAAVSQMLPEGADLAASAT